MTDDLRKTLDYLEAISPETREELGVLENLPRKRDTLMRLAVSALYRLTGGTKVPAFIPPHPSKLPDKGYPIGNILNGEEIFAPLRMEFREPTIGIFGTMGSGKTTVIMCGIVPAAIENGRQSIIWDYDDQYHRILCPLYPTEEVRAYKPRQFKVNFIAPPKNTSPDEWKNEFCSSLRPLWAGEGMIELARSGMSHAFANHDTPTIFHIKRWIDNLDFKTTDSRYKSLTSLKRCFNMILDCFSETFDCAEGFLKKDVLDVPCTIFRMKGIDLVMGNWFQDLFIERLRYARDSYTEEGQTLMIFEECHLRFSVDIQRRETEVGERKALIHSRVLRKYGFSCIYADQIPSLLPMQLLGGLGAVLCFRLVNSQDIRRVGDILGLDEEQRDAITTLPKKRAVAFSYLSQLNPSLVEIFDYQIHKAPPEEIEVKVQQVISKLHYIPISKEKEEQEDPEKSKLNKTHIDILRIYADPKFWFASQEQKQRAAGGIHPEYFMRIVKDLQEMELLGPLQKVSQPAKGRPFQTAWPTEKGGELLQVRDYCPKGKGSAQHIFYQHYLKSKLPNSTVEFMSTDLVKYEKDGSMTAFEIELDSATPHVIINIQHDLPLFQKIVVVSRNATDLKTLKQNVKEHFKDGPELLESVSFKTIQEVVKNGG